MRPHTPNVDLQAAARESMLKQRFQPDLPPAAKQQLSELQQHPPKVAADGNIRDLRALLWSSIDNDTSRDLDQLEVADRLPNGDARVRIAIADVDAFVAKGSPIDNFAAQQTTTVYAGVHNFSMLPDQLSTDATSLLENGDKLSVVYEFVVSAEGTVKSSDIYRAVVHNHAQLAYNAVGAWLENTGPAPEKVAASPELKAQLRLPDEIAQALRNERHVHGALDLETVELRPLVFHDQIVDLVSQEKNRATELIEDFMVA